MSREKSLGFVIWILTALLLDPASTPAQAETTGSASAEPAQILSGGEGASILGREVRSAADEKLGRIIDVVVDRSGAPRAAIIDFGGFLGVGSRKIAVAWDLLTFTAAADGAERITVQTTRDRLNTAPEFKDGKPIVILSERAPADHTQATLRSPER